MNNLFEMSGQIVIKMDDAIDDLEEVTDKAEETADSVVDKFKGAAKLLVGMFAVDKIFDFGKVAVEAAAGAQALEAQFEQVFGSLQDEANTMIDGMAEEFGMLPNRILPSFTQLTAMFKGVGMEAESAMGTAEQVTTSAADAAAFYDVSMESAQASLTSFIKGNYQAGEAVGIFATDAQMAQFAIQEGVVDSTASWRDLDEATKMATRADYITNMQEMSGATGQAARESEEYENVMGNLRQAWQDFLAVVGAPILEAVIPIIQGVTTAVTEFSTGLDGVVEKYQAWSEDHPILSSALEGLAIGLGIVGLAMGIYSLNMALATAATTAFTAVMSVLLSPMTLIVAGVVALIAVVYTLWQNWETVGPMLAQVWENIKTWVVEKVSAMAASVASWFSQMWSRVTTYVNNTATSIRTGFTEGWNTVKEKVKGMYDAVVEWFSKIPDKIRELWSKAQSYLANVNLYSIGRNIINGLWNGLNSAWGAVSSWISEKAASISGLWERALRIFSPSRVMREDIGRNIIMGLLRGLEDIWPKITGFMDKAISYIAGVDFTTPDVNIGANYALKQSNQTTITTRGMMEETNFLLRKLLQKDTDLIINGRVLSEEILDDINELNELYNNRNIKIQGGVV